MKVLKIVDFAKRPLGDVSQSADGQLTLHVVDESFRSDLEAFVERVRSQPVYLISGERSQKGNRTAFTTRRKLVRPDDTEFLVAVQGLLRTVRFDGTRVRGLLLRGDESDDR